MRSNGLTASSYSPVADLDPRAAEALLGELREQGVAAYTRPVESTTMSGFDRPEVISGALDRLYVDAAASDKVSAQLTAKDPTLATISDDLTWAQIVAGFDLPVLHDVNPWPANEDLDWSSTGSTSEVADAADEGALDQGAEGGGPRGSRTHDLRSWLAQRDATTSQAPADHLGDLDDVDTRGRRRDEEDRFVPDPPPPLPTLQPLQQVAWLGLLGGPLLLLVSALFALSLPGWLTVLAVGGFIGGFVTLVATMGDRDDDWNSDNGAVV